MSATENEDIVMSKPITPGVGFLDLPAELRNMAYELYVDEIAHTIPFPLLRYATREVEIKHRSSQLKLLLVSKQIRREALSILCTKIQPTLTLTDSNALWHINETEWMRDVLAGCEKLEETFGDQLRLFRSIRLDGWRSLRVFSIEGRARYLGLQNAAAARVLGLLVRVESVAVYDAGFTNVRHLMSTDEPWLALHLRTRRTFDNMMRAMTMLREIVCDSGIERQVCKVEPEVGGSWKIICVSSGVAMEMENWE